MQLSATRGWASAVLLLSTSVGCSAVVSPDPSRLGGGSDAGLDARVGPAPDAFVDPTVDAFVDPTVDAFVATPDAFVEPRIDAFVPGTLPDTCATAGVIDVSSGNAVVRGDFASLAADYDTFCIEGGGRGRDAVYRIDLGPARATELRIETVGEVDTVLSVSSSCGEFRLPSCNDDQRPGDDDNARVWLHPAVGTLYLLVSAFDATSGPYEVRLTTSPLFSNECGGDTLDVTEGGTVIGVALPPARATGTCMPDGSRGLLESALRFEGGDIDRLRAYALFDATIHVRADSCDLADQVACRRSSPIGGGGTFTETNVRSEASRLHVFLDGATSSDQVYALFVEP
jgi:hypothetical protein